MNRPRAVDFIDADRPSAAAESIEYENYSESESEQEVQEKLVESIPEKEEVKEALPSGAISKGKNSLFIRDLPVFTQLSLL